MRYVFTILILLITSVISDAQVTRVQLSEQEIVDKALEQNYELLLANYDIMRAEGEMKTAEKLRLPDLKLSYTGITTDNPLMAFGSKLNQELVTSADFAPESLNHPDRIENFSTTIELEQPILNFDLPYFRDAARTKLEATELKSERLMDAITLQVKQTYLQLQLAYKQLDVLAIARSLVNESHRVAQNQFNEGLMQKSDLLAIGVRVAEIDNQILDAEHRIAKISRQLSLLMNESIQGPIEPSEELNQNERPEANPHLSSSRSDFQAMQKATESYRLYHEGLKKGHLPRFNGFANYAFNDSSPVKFRGEGYLLGLQLSWNILGNKKSEGKVQQSKADFQKSQIAYQKMFLENETELLNTLNTIESANSRIDLAQQALLQSEESLRIRKNRFEEGLERTTDLLQSESQYAQKQMEYHHAIFQYNSALEYLTFLTKS